jgi:pantothenate kinase
MRKVKLAAILLTSFVIIMLGGRGTSVASQAVDPSAQLNSVFQDVLKAEAAGATTKEIHGLLVELNSVLELQDQLQQLGPGDNYKRMNIQQQVNSTLVTVDSQANQIEETAAQRTFMNHIYLYGSGIIGALLVSLTYHYGVLLWRKQRIKRIFRMTVAPK